MEFVTGTMVAGRFRLERRLGQGGMGSVWLAHQESLDRPCALKFLHPEAASSPDLRARFEREAKAAAGLGSAHVVQIFDHGVWEGMPFIVMERLEGEDLAQRLHRVGKLDPRSTAQIVTHVARALAKAHAAGLVHRDLKPANIFLVRDEDREVAKVVDFGVAKRTALEISDSHTKTGAILGTPFYMSPEQARGLREVDHRSDLWALGVIAFQCLTGRRPFESEALGDLFGKIMYEPLPVPSQVGPVPAGFDAWWARAAQRDPARRFQTARELADALTLAMGISTSLVDVDAPKLPPPPAALPDNALPTQVLPTTPMRPLAAAQTANPVAGEVPARGGRGAVMLAAGMLGVAALVLAAAGVIFLRRQPSAPSAAEAPPVEPAITMSASAPTPSATNAEPVPQEVVPVAPASSRAPAAPPASPGKRPSQAPKKPRPPGKSDPFAQPD